MSRKLYRSETLRLVIEGPYGLFTKPEFRSDRVTYPFSPPTAAIGVPKAIFWHPDAYVHKGEQATIEVDILAIHVLNPIQYIRMTVNEVGEIPEFGGRSKKIVEIPSPMVVTPRQTSLVLLKDPKFLYEFQYVSNTSQSQANKGADIFTRRLARGQSFRQPCLGRRRYPATVREPTPEDKPIDHTEDFGRMSWGREFIRGAELREVLHMFHAKMENGVVKVPSFQGMLAGEQVIAP